MLLNIQIQHKSKTQQLSDEVFHSLITNEWTYKIRIWEVENMVIRKIGVLKGEKSPLLYRIFFTQKDNNMWALSLSNRLEYLPKKD